MNTKDDKAKGCGCGVDLKKEVNNIVKEGTKPTKEQHDKKRVEINSAFKNDTTNNMHDNAHNVHSSHNDMHKDAHKDIHNKSGMSCKADKNHNNDIKNSMDRNDRDDRNNLADWNNRGKKDDRW